MTALPSCATFDSKQSIYMSMNVFLITFVEVPLEVNIIFLNKKSIFYSNQTLDY